MEELKNCHDCGTKPGENHHAGCDVERCPVCGGQALMCLSESPCCDKIIASCENVVVEDADLIPWTGIWPGVEECREFGWYCIFVPEKGFKQAQKDDPEATEDLNRLYVDAVWDRKLKRRVLKK